MTKYYFSVGSEVIGDGVTKDKFKADAFTVLVTDYTLRETVVVVEADDVSEAREKVLEIAKKLGKNNIKMNVYTPVYESDIKLLYTE